MFRFILNQLIITMANDPPKEPVGSCRKNYRIASGRTGMHWNLIGSLLLDFGRKLVDIGKYGNDNGSY